MQQRLRVGAGQYFPSWVSGANTVFKAEMAMGVGFVRYGYLGFLLLSIKDFSCQRLDHLFWNRYGSRRDAWHGIGAGWIRMMWETGRALLELVRHEIHRSPPLSICCHVSSSQMPPSVSRSKHAVRLYEHCTAQRRSHAQPRPSEWPIRPLAPLYLSRATAPCLPRSWASTGQTWHRPFTCLLLGPGRDVASRRPRAGSLPLSCRRPWAVRQRNGPWENWATSGRPRPMA
jgi:hypothetical protein